MSMLPSVTEVLRYLQTACQHRQVAWSRRTITGGLDAGGVSIRAIFSKTTRWQDHIH
jgi:hypothetical protein